MACGLPLQLSITEDPTLVNVMVCNLKTGQKQNSFRVIAPSYLCDMASISVYLEPKLGTKTERSVGYANRKTQKNFNRYPPLTPERSIDAFPTRDSKVSICLQFEISKGHINLKPFISKNPHLKTGVDVLALTYQNL